MLESGTAPSDTMVAEFLTDCPPGSDLAASCKLGMFTPGGALVAIADMAFGYPETDDAYIGLLLIDENCRGMGLGRTFLDHLIATARARNAARLLIAALDENSRGRAFWEREGFRLLQSIAGFKAGLKTHIVHRMWRPL
ncbi:GNAT family N-acetyltransferase [Aminobacter anthyllidis]|uniref:GNAT family N-acetyltransferase n=1 Tax=Aminobacter anthyllidis TaxID=1035067 RepID=A0A9X1AA93_9HYPH|nr:GNAT family N-acetyltransferase [Aminobacter anthyllidis]MBT1156174.1 GNAT family N-acetyltransferase [Aminobacter anthyllidis]